MEEKMVSAKRILERLRALGQIDEIPEYIPDCVLDEIGAVLTYGDLLYPDAVWRSKDKMYHHKHAMEHLSVAGSAPGARDESGCYQVAHAIVRLMFFLAQVIEEERHESNGDR